MTTIENKTFDEERALYGSHDVLLKNSAFGGPAEERARSRRAAIFRWTMSSAISVILSGTITG